MAISFVQHAKIDIVGSSTTATANFTNPIAAGSIIVVMGMFDNAANSLTAATDLGGSPTYSPSGFVLNGAIPAYSFALAFFSPPTGAQHVTLTYNATITYGDFFIWEIAGLTSAQFDKVLTRSDSTTTPTAGSTGTLSAANEAATLYAVSSNTMTGVGSGWTDDGLTAYGSQGGERVLASSASINGDATAGAGTCQIWAATFMSGGGGGTSPIAWNMPDEDRRRGPPQAQADFKSAWAPRVFVPVPISGIAWMRPPPAERILPPYTTEQRLAWAPRIFAPVNTNSGIPWMRPADADRPLFRPLEPYSPTWSPRFIPAVGISGEAWETPFEEKRPPPGPDSYRIAWVPKAPTPTVPISGMAWKVGPEEKRPPPPPDQYVPWVPLFPAQVFYAGANADEMFPWFGPPRFDVRQAFVAKVTASTVGIAGQAWENSPEERRPPAPIDVYRLTWSPRSIPAVGVSGTAWEAPFEDLRPRPQADVYRLAWSPQQIVTPVGIAGQAWGNSQEERRPAPALDVYRLAWAPQQITAFVGISGQAWENPAEERRPLPPVDVYRLTWAPQFVPAVGVSGIAWQTTKEEQRPPQRFDLTGTTWAPRPFVQSVGISGMAWAQPPADVRLRPPFDVYQATWVPPQPFVAPVGIAGMAWLTSKEEQRPLPPPIQYVPGWTPGLAPQIISTFPGGFTMDLGMVKIYSRIGY